MPINVGAQDVEITILVPATEINGTAQELIEHLNAVRDARVTVDGMLFDGAVVSVVVR